ncbi:unnamed protein product [Linum tenue]|uniref:Uncharacterized protein n=1 Tax=Linum tenue TaxID=586396 RepID=A0AAV0KUB0_9ROSI|nr:unnamed protein product [Linum tenue]
MSTILPMSTITLTGSVSKFSIPTLKFIGRSMDLSSGLQISGFFEVEQINCPYFIYRCFILVGTNYNDVAIE